MRSMDSVDRRHLLRLRRMTGIAALTSGPPSFATRPRRSILDEEDLKGFPVDKTVLMKTLVTLLPDSGESMRYRLRRTLGRQSMLGHTRVGGDRQGCVR